MLVRDVVAALHEREIAGHDQVADATGGGVLGGLGHGTGLEGNQALCQGGLSFLDGGGELGRGAFFDAAKRQRLRGFHVVALGQDVFGGRQETLDANEKQQQPQQHALFARQMLPDQEGAQEEDDIGADSGQKQACEGNGADDVAQVDGTFPRQFFCPTVSDPGPVARAPAEEDQERGQEADGAQRPDQIQDPKDLVLRVGPGTNEGLVKGLGSLIEIELQKPVPR